MQQQLGQQSNNMMQMMGAQMGNPSQQQQFGSNSFTQGSGMSSAAGNALLNRFGGLSSQFSDPQQQSTASSLLGGNRSFLDSALGNDLFSGFSQQQGSGGIQSNLRQFGMADDLLQRRLSLGLGGSGNGGGMNNNSTLQQQLNNMSGGGGGGGSGGWGGNGPSSNSMFAGLDQFQGTDTSNLEGLMASQLQQQQQQQQLSLQQQLMLAAQQQGDNLRRSSLGGTGAGGMDPSFGLQLSMMGQQQQSMGAGLDMSSPQHQQLMQLQRQQESQNDQSDHEESELSGKARPVASAGDDGKKTRKKKAKTFPEKLMQAITSHGEEDAVAWLPDGKSFVIVNDDLFVEQVLNNVFKESKYTSFVRKLHRWGFVRLTSGTGTDCFHHPLFQRGRRDLASKITCTPRDKEGNLKTPHRNMKPPSLAGVERFIRQKADAAVAIAEAKARHRDSDQGDSVPLRSTSGLASHQSSIPSQLVMEGLDKPPEPLGIGGRPMTGDTGGMRKEIVKSIGDNESGQAKAPFHMAGERANV
eukprot:scaffold6647_cov166-Amphora_coffeaeformis.AAC.9